MALSKKEEFRPGNVKLKDKSLLDLENLTKEKLLKADDDDVKKLKDYIFDARSKLNPFKVKVDGCDEGSLLFSFINMQREYMTKFIATGFLGFLRRAVNEWGVPDAPVSVPVIDVVDYLKDPTLADPAPVDSGKISQDILDAYDKNKKMMAKRIVVAEFLEYMFGFDPDRHARPGYKPNFEDPERRPIMTPSGELSVLIEKRRIEKEKKTSISEKKEYQLLYAQYLEEKKRIAEGEKVEKPCIRTVRRTIKDKNGNMMEVERKIKCTELEYKVMQMKKDDPESSKNLIVAESESKIIPDSPPNWKDYFNKQNQARDQAIHDVVRDLIPPADMFYKFNVYLDKHYEQVQDAVRDLYHVKPDFDAAICAYKHVEVEKKKNGEIVPIADQVKKFRHANERDLNFSINEIQFGKWTMIAPYKQNRERVEYYGQNMAIFEEMFKMKASEKLLAKDMMDKAVARKRREVQAVHGKNDPNFEKSYGTLGSQNLDKLGLEKVKDDDDDTPDDAIEVGVFRISQGGKKIDVDKFYTQAEAPEFMIK
jgi:hypothetical protein